MPTSSWQGDALCARLSPVQSDQIFFPGSGGKPTKARKFCGQCPVKEACLDDALKYGLEGFFGGTTDNERRAIVKRYNIKVVPMAIQIEAMVTVLKPKRKRFVSFGPAIKEPADTLEYLDSLD